MGDGRMDKVLIFCGIGVLLVIINVGANILAQRAIPTLEGDNFGRHEYGVLVKLFVFAIVMGTLGAVGIGHMVP
jgi:hypothetical protein